MEKHSIQRGFTSVELCMGMAITTLVMGAMAAFCMAMTSAWKSAEKSQALTLTSNQVVLRIQNAVRNAKLIGASLPGSANGSAAGAAVLLWKQDTNADGYIQGDEVELIEHDTATNKLNHYYVGQPDGAGTWSYSATFSAAATITSFKTNRLCVPLASGVYGAIFETSGTTGTSQNPKLQFSLKLMRDDSQSDAAGSSAVGGEAKLLVQYGTASVRAPLAQPIP